MLKITHPIRIQLIEDVVISEAGLHCLLKTESDFNVLPHFPCNKECNHACMKNDPDILLMVMHSSSQCGLGCIQQITSKYPAITILVLCMQEDPYLAKRLLDLGVMGVIYSQTPPDILFRAIRKVAAGGSYIDTDIARAIAALNSASNLNPFSVLSSREHEITRMMLSGLNQKEIGKHLFISPHTVANHHTHILKKLHVQNHIELTKLAIRHGFTSV